MKAVTLHGYGGVDQLFYQDVPQPEPQPGEVLVKVMATSINPADLKLRRGDFKDQMQLQFPAIPGYDVAGVIAGLGPDIKGLQLGDRVMGIANHAYAEFLVTKTEVLTHIPEGLETGDAAALPLVLTTGAQLIEKGVLPTAGQTVIITGAMGGVGRTAVHVAKKHGMRVIAGVRARERSQAEALGADRVVAVDDQQEIASLGPVDAIADTVGRDVIARLMPCIRHSGVLATVVGKPDGAVGQAFLVREVWAVPDAHRLHQLAKAVAAKEFSIPIARRMKLSQAREAHTLAEAGGISKILLLP